MKSDFFYSKSTRLFVARKPLKIDSRIFKSAEKAGVTLSWDDEGRINYLNFDDSKKLLLSLGAKMLSPVEYWKVLEDAKKEGDIDMVQELCSDQYCELLDRVYSSDGYFLDHPIILKKYNYSGKKLNSNEVFGRPGWFNPENNISLLGTPKKVKLFRDKFSTSWKYWSPDFSVTKLKFLTPIRGYVTSVGKPSFDLGIPVDARQPMQMIRECRVKPLNPPVDLFILNQATELINGYENIIRNLRSQREYENFYKNRERYIHFINKYGSLFSKSKEIIIYKIREKLYDCLGLLKLISIQKKDEATKEKLDSAAFKISGIKSKTISFESFFNFMKTSKKRLNKASLEKKDVIFVMGHKNPDTDTIISSLLEAWRNSLLDPVAEYIPIVQNHKIPDEVRELLGEELSSFILLNEEESYTNVKNSGLARWISVDQNKQSDVQKYFIAMIDHHVTSEIARIQNLPKTLELVGSCTSLIFQKLLAANIYPDEKISRILYGATLMDTENRIAHKMTIKDGLAMDLLKNLSNIKEDNLLYGNLMSFLLNTDDARILFGRDYKEDWGFGFAVIKVKNAFSKNGDLLKESLIKEVLVLANKNNLIKNLPLTIVRITDYEEDHITVNRERVYPVFNQSASQNFISSIFNLIENIVKFEFGKVNILRKKEFIEFWGTGVQLSRKKTAPILEPVVNSFNEYFYSPTNRFWVKRDFLKYSPDATVAARKDKISLSKDNNQRLNYLTFSESKNLIKNLGFFMLSLKEYWACLNDAKKISDVQMIESLEGSNFVEFTDTIIKDNRIIIEHPNIVHHEKGIALLGKELKVNVPAGSPGLISPAEIDLHTGIPKKVRSPSEYGNSELWRYWAPDSNLVVPTRSYIFLLKRPCWDGKVHLDDSFPNLGIRPCCKNLVLPKIDIQVGKNNLSISINKEGKKFNYIWKK